ncbi:nucleoside triphosphate pyrophosphohydrolase [Treponema sp. HNW]|uniref:nucleoside triphosphate pyrophosphohydrolase n=1 Tax=unclassified Treponema TaxID=2638727 RepID=UPI003D1222EE
MKIENNNRKIEEQKEALEAASGFKTLYGIIKTLRAPGGCPWDREQTPLSLRPTLLEETYEALDALSEYEKSGASSHVKEELGDVMLNAAMIGYMFEQDGDFTVADIFDEVCEKLVRRHPHVFPESEGRVNALAHAETPEQVLNQWDAIKAGIEGRKAGDSILDGAGKGLDPLTRAFKMQKKAAKKGFDWSEAAAVREKVLEEIAEIDEAVRRRADAPLQTAGQNQSTVEDEIGDLLFAVVNWARHLGVAPAVALEKANAKFRRRFKYVEKRCKEGNIEMQKENLAVMDSFWDKAKTEER